MYCLWYHQMNMYNELIDNTNMWYDSINDVHDNELPHDYFYVYLSCLSEFNYETE